MKKKIAEKIVRMAEKSAYKVVGKSFPLGVHEIKPPEELLKRKRGEKNGSVVQGIASRCKKQCYI